MGFFKEMIHIARIEGVKHYILVDHNQQVIVHNLKDYRRIGAMICFCGLQSYALGKSRLKFLIFERKNHNDLFIFPVGNYYLGVIKHKTIGAVELTHNVLAFLNELVSNRPDKNLH